MKRVFVIILSVFVAINVMGQAQNKRFLEYISKYKHLAIKEQYLYGIPASITMAQALIESNAGQSMLAVKGRNHFGIKCGSNWTGKTILKDDDNIQDCFRSYNKVIESYEDHSQFLKRSRYASLYNIPLKDYKAWARELKRLGYATDPNYANKLIKIIEDYNLNDLIYESYVDDGSISGEIATNEGNEQVRRNTADSTFDYSDLLTKTKNNGRTCYILKKDATIAEVAAAINKRNINTLLYYNDMFEDFTLKAGTFVYVSKKRNKGDERYRSYNVKEGDSMHSISQHFGITLKALYKINNLTYGTPATEGMTLFLQR